MQSKKLSLVAALTFGFLLGTSGMASAQWTPYVGGNGGGAFSHSCGSVPVIAFNLRAGAFIDSLQSICWNGIVSPVFGGNGGSPATIGCATSTNWNRAMRGVNTYYSWVVTAIQGFCQSMASTDTNTTQWVGSKSDNYKSLRCAQGTGIKQIRGGSGLYLDSLSIYCGDF